MKRFIEGLLISIFLLSLATTVFAFGFGRVLDQPPAPDLIEPHVSNVDLSGKDYLEFKWSIIDLMSVSYCKFSLYKGGIAYSDYLIYQEEVIAPNHVVKVKSELFEDGQEYCWVVYEVCLDGRKSEKAFDSFRVKKIQK